MLSLKYIECSIHNTKLTTAYEILHARNDETGGNIELLQPYHVIVAYALLEIDYAVISGVLSFDEH
jgi:hypothetical protein